MPRLKFTETYLSSSVIVMPTANLEKFKADYAEYNNLPDFEDQTAAIDSPDENGERRFPHLSFISIEQDHDGCLYPIDDQLDSVGLDDALPPYIEQGTEFKLQFVQFEGSGLQYYSFTYNSQGMINTVKDDPLNFDSKFLINRSVKPES